LSLRFSIVLCTRNRAHILCDALESIARVDYPKDDFELVVVNNASTDDTAKRVAEFAERVPFRVRCVDESREGLSNARNCGIAAADGHWIFFTDDDQLVDSRALMEHERVATKYDARAQQGAIALSFPEGRPDWLRKNLSVVLGQTENRPEGPQQMDLFGGNMVFRRDLFDEVAGFDPTLGKGAAGYSEDIEITRRLADIGEPIVYAPSALVYHVILRDRANAKFFRENSYEKGYSDGVRLGSAQSALAVVGAASWGVIRGVTQGTWGFVRRDSYHVVIGQTRIAKYVGKVIGYLSVRGR
jgi:glycosyltransferase involved in cell wall biosynthesis